MDKFQDVKVGDKVLVPIRVTVGWRSKEIFYCLKSVEKVTKTQFTAGGVRAKKEQGRVIGSNNWYSILKEGDSNGSFEKRIITDETEDMERFKKALSLVYYIEKAINIDIPLNRNTNLDNLIIAYNKKKEFMKAIDKLLKKEEN